MVRDSRDYVLTTAFGKTLMTAFKISGSVALRLLFICGSVGKSLKLLAWKMVYVAPHRRRIHTYSVPFVRVFHCRRSSLHGCNCQPATYTSSMRGRGTCF